MQVLSPFLFQEEYMYIRIGFFVLLFSLLACPAFAAYSGPSAATPATKGGYTGPGPGVSTVAEALNMRDDAHVTLRGTIVRHIGGEKYLFQDKSGSITVEIDDEDWNGLTVSATDMVEIRGEVDKDWNSVEVDVDTIRKAE